MTSLIETSPATHQSVHNKRQRLLAAGYAALEQPEFPHINMNRLWDDIQKTAQWGQIPNSTGLTRLSLSEDDRKVREWFIGEAEKLGCEIKVDGMGNIFAILPGTVEGLAPIGMGSHLDSQPSGGRYDGILGVIAALEVLRTVKESGIKTRSPLAAINWTNEEGARFFPGCSGSAVWSSWVSIKQAHKLEGRTGQDSSSPSSTVTLGEALDAIDQKGSTPCSYMENPLQAHFELHIEQGPILEREQKLVGVVQNIYEILRYKVVVKGKRGHAGTVPMTKRTDALMAACRIVLSLEEMAIEADAFATVGTWNVRDPSPNVIPDHVQFTIDLRHRSASRVGAIESSLREKVKGMKTLYPSLKVDISCVWRSPAATFDERAVLCVESAAVNTVGAGSVMDMTSLAGHDSALVAMRVPSAMIFVPSIGGTSHAPEEMTHKSDCGLGTQTLLRAVLEYDSRYNPTSKS